jgi:hypothetical protein
MVESILNYIHIYLSRPTVVVMDMLLLSMGLAVLVVVILLRRKVVDLNVAIDMLGKKLDRGKSK